MVTANGIATKRITLLGLVPVITSINPLSGPVGTTAFINGHEFGAAQNASTVVVGGLPAEIVFWGDKRLGIKIPQLDKGSYPVIVSTASGQANKSFRVRDLILLTERGPCDDSFLGTLAGTCWVLSPFETAQRQGNSGIQVNIVVQNIRRRWYEVTVSSVGTTIPGPNRFIIGPENRRGAAKKSLKNVPVGLGSSITFFADGRSPKALRMHALDLVFIATTGNPIPGNRIDLALQLLERVRSLSAFGLAVGAGLAQIESVPDAIAILGNLRNLPDLAAQDPSLSNALKILGVSDKQLATLGNIGNGARLVSIIATELETLTAPQFDNVTLVAR